MTPYTGEVHPSAARFPLLGDDAMEALADDIRANGLRDALTISPDGVLLDGRNRLVACERAGVEPVFEVYDGDAAALIVSRNVERRNLTPGEQAMARALDLADAGHRKGGRWSTKAGVATNVATGELDHGWRAHMKKAGAVIDASRRWPDDAGDLPERVLAGDVALDAAYLALREIESAHTIADFRLHKPCREWMGELSGLVIGLRHNATTGLPELAAPITPDDVRAISEMASEMRSYIKAIDEFGKGNSE